MPKKFKDIIRQIHLWLGLGAGLIVFVISITGCLYVFEKEIRDFTQKDYLYVPVKSQGFIGLNAIIQSFNKISGDDKITLIRIQNSQANATVVLTTARDKVYYFNPYSAELVKKTSQDWLYIVQEIHTSLLLGESGKFIIRWSVVIFVIMLITGIILWFPGQLRLLKQGLKIKWSGSFKRLNYDLHNVLGFYSSGILLIIALSGLYFGFKEVKTAVSFLTGTTLSEGKQPTINFQKKVYEINYSDLYKSTALSNPGAESSSLSIRKTGEVRIRMIHPYKGYRKQNTYYFDSTSGRLLRYKLYRDFNSADVVEAANYDLHTGQMFGLLGKVVACIVSLISASLPVTGFIMWMKKKGNDRSLPKAKSGLLCPDIR